MKCDPGMELSAWWLHNQGFEALTEKLLEPSANPSVFVNSIAHPFRDGIPSPLTPKLEGQTGQPLVLCWWM